MPLAAKDYEHIMRSFRPAVIDPKFVHFESIILAVIPPAHYVLRPIMIEINYAFLDDCVCLLGRHDPIHSLSAGIPESSFPRLLPADPVLLPLDGRFRLPPDSAGALLATAA